MGFREGLEAELGVKADRALAVKMISRGLSSWAVYRLYCRLGAAPWQALGIVTTGNQLLGIARAVKGDLTTVTVDSSDDQVTDWVKVGDGISTLFGSIRTERGVR